MLSRPPSIERRVCAPSSELMSMRVASSAPSSTSTSSQLSLCFAEISQMKKKEFQGEIWEEWALTYGRNGSSERKNTSASESRGVGGRPKAAGAPNPECGAPKLPRGGAPCGGAPCGGGAPKAEAPGAPAHCCWSPII